MTLPEPPCTTLHLPSAPANRVHLGLKLLRKIEILRRRCERRKQVHNQRHRGPFGGSLLRLRVATESAGGGRLLGLQKSSRLERAVEARRFKSVIIEAPIVGLQPL